MKTDEIISEALEATYQKLEKEATVPASAMILNDEWYVPKYGGDTLDFLLDIYRADLESKDKQMADALEKQKGEILEKLDNEKSVLFVVKKFKETNKDYVKGRINQINFFESYIKSIK